MGKDINGKQNKDMQAFEGKISSILDTELSATPG